jgi:hypothetical protein
MSTTTTTVRWFSRFPKALAAVTLLFAALGSFAQSFAQEKTFAERAKEYRDKIVASMESTAKAAGDEFSKLKSESTEATGPAREKLAAKMETASKKWAAAREKLATSLDAHMRSVRDQLKTLEEKAPKTTGSAREQTSAEIEKLRGEWHVAREKMSAALSSNMKAAREEFAHLKDQSANGSGDAKAKVASRMEKLKAEWSKNREKLSAHLDAELKQTKAEMEKLRDETSKTAKLAKETLMKKYHDLRARHDDLAKEQAIDASK